MKLAQLGSRHMRNLVALAGVSVALYLSRLAAPFVSDDHLIFYRLQQGGVFGFASRPPTAFYRPLISLHYYLDYALWGMNPLLSHLVNVLWHVCVAVLLYFLAIQVLQRWGWRLGVAVHGAFWGALVFVVLPANVEAVAWFAARADIVATAAALCTLLLLMRFLRTGDWLSYLGAVGVFAGGLFCKESLLSFPLIVWLWLRWMGVQKAWRYALPFFGVLVVYWSMRTTAVSGLGAYPEAWATLYQPWLLGINLVAYLGQMAMPAILYGAGRDVWDTFAWVIWLSGAMLMAFAWRTDPVKPPRTVDWRLLGATALLALLPVLIFKPSPFYFLNSRYSYLASAFVAIGAGALIHMAMRRHLWAMIGASLVLFAYVVGTLRQVDAWRIAGTIARSSLMSLRELPADRPLLLLGVPDHYHGAYIWRADLWKAIQLLLPERGAQPIHTASRFTMRLRTDVAIEYADGVARLSSPDDIFLRPEEELKPLGDEPIVLPTRLIIHWSLQQRYQLVGYADGRFVLIEASPATPVSPSP